MKKTGLGIAGLFISLSLVLSACGGGAAPASGGDELQGNIAVSGAFALYPMMTVWADEFTKLHPDVHFDVQGGGAGKGMTDTLAGAVDIGMISRKIKPEEEAQGAYWVAVAKDAVFPIVSAQNPVLDQLISKGITQETFKKSSSPAKSRPGVRWWVSPVTDEIHVYTRSDSAGAADQWALFSGGKVQATSRASASMASPRSWTRSARTRWASGSAT